LEFRRVLSRSAASSVTSAATKRTRSPSSLAMVSPLDDGRSMMTICAPSFSRALTVARPRPEAPPVTTATLSLTIIDYPFESCCGSEFLRTSETFDDGGVGHARALAHRLQTVATTGGLEVVDEGRQQSGARRAERVTERDRAAPRVELGRVGTEFVGPGERHGRERLVD